MWNCSGGGESGYGVKGEGLICRDLGGCYSCFPFVGRLGAGSVVEGVRGEEGGVEWLGIEKRFLACCGLHAGGGVASTVGESSIGSGEKFLLLDCCGVSPDCSREYFGLWIF